MEAESPVDDKTPGVGRPRDPRIDAAILAATAELLVEIGYNQLTMAAIAARAGTTKTALYRRWSSKSDLVHEAAFPAAPSALTGAFGDVADDVRAMLRSTRDVFVSPVVRAALPGLIADMAADSDLALRVLSRLSILFDAVRERLRVGAGTGEVHPDVDPDRLVDLIGGATLLRVLLSPGEGLSDEWVEQTAAIIVHGVKREAGPSA
jgi:AcrR family transcriptional regulator